MDEPSKTLPSIIRMHRFGDDHGARRLQFGSLQFVCEAFDALIAVRESVIGDQILPDGCRSPPLL